MKVRYTLPAAADLDGILEYVTSRSPHGARRVAARIKAVETLLVQFPFSGSRTRLAWVRRIATVPYPYLIFYEVTENEVIVHAIRHGARRPASMPGN